MTALPGTDQVQIFNALSPFILFFPFFKKKQSYGHEQNTLGHRLSDDTIALTSHLLLFSQKSHSWKILELKKMKNSVL